MSTSRIHGLNALIIAGTLWSVILLVAVGRVFLQKGAHDLPPTLREHAPALIVFVPLGWLGGMLCGFPVLLLGDYLGRSGITGTEYFGYWAPEHAWFLASEAGSLVGALITPAFYLAKLRHVPAIQWPPIAVWATCGTLAGGFLGALFGPPMTLVAGCEGFWYAATLGLRRHPGA